MTRSRAARFPLLTYDPTHSLSNLGQATDRKVGGTGRSTLRICCDDGLVGKICHILDTVMFNVFMRVRLALQG